MSGDDNNALEAEAFDRQIEERVANGHLPDIRECKPCDWFYNNPWRHPEYVKLDFGEQFEVIRDAIKQHLPSSITCPEVLEIGCGPGYLSLELARTGFNVTGVDISKRCIEVANDFADKDPYKNSIPARGDLRYMAVDFRAGDALRIGSFDAVVFLGALHHFPDLVSTLKRVKELLKPSGILIAHEPVRDKVTEGNAIFMHLLRVVLSASGGFYKDYPIPTDSSACDKEFRQVYAQMRYETESGEKVQSPNDNESGYAEMYPVLSSMFKELKFTWRYAFFHEVIGGLRFPDEKNFAMARYLRYIDGELVKRNVLSPTEFLFVGRVSTEMQNG